MKKAAFIHSTPVTVEDMKKVFKEKFPDVQLINIVDDSILPEVEENDGFTPGIVKRLMTYASHAQEMGASVVLNVCTSIGGAADIASKALNIPYLKVDGPMMKKAVESGERIAVIVTAGTTLKSSVISAENAAKEAGKAAKVKGYFVDGAFDALLKEGDREKHNRLVVEAVEFAARENDVIVLAQGSMMHLVGLLKHIDKPILTSVDMGIEQLREYLV